MKSVIHINRNIIQYNAKHGKSLPCCRVEQGSNVRYCMEVNIQGDSSMVYRPDNPRPCGAKLWIETNSPVSLVGERPWTEIKKELKDNLR